MYTNRAMSPGPTNLLGCSNSNSGPDPLNSVRQHLTKTLLRTPPSYYYYHQQNSLGPLNDPLPLSTNSISMPSLISNNTNAMRPLPPTRNQSFQPHLPAARKLSKLSNLCWVSSVSQPDLTLTTTTLSPVNSLPTSRASSPGAPLSRCTSPHPPPPLAGGSPYGSAYRGGGGGSLGGSQVGLSSLTNTTSSSSYYLNQLANQPLVRHQPVYTSRFDQRQSAAALLFPSSSSPPNHMFQPDPGPLLPMSYHPQLHSHRSPEPQPFFGGVGGGGWSGSGGLLYSPPLPELLSPSYEQQQQFNAWNVSCGSMSPPPYPTEVLLSDINGNQQEWQQQEHKQQHWQQEQKQQHWQQEHKQKHWQQEHMQHWQQEHKKHWQPMVSACCSGVGGPAHRIDLNQNHVGGGGGEQHYLQQQQQQQQQQQLRASPSRSLAGPSFPGGGGVEQGKPCAIIMPQQQQQLLGREEGGGCRCSLSSSAPSPPSPLFGLPHAGDMEQLYKQQQQRAVSVPRQTAATSPQQPSPRSLWLPRLQRSVGTSCSDLLAWEQQQQQQEQFPASNSTAVVATTIPFVVEMCQICNVFLKGSGDGQCARPYYRYSPCQYGGQVVVAAAGEGGQPPRRGPPAQLILKRWAK